MSKLARNIMKVFGQNGGTTQFGQFGSNQASPPGNTTKDITQIQALSNYLTGWFDATNNKSEPPRIEDRNGLDYLMTSQLAYLYQTGIPEWLDSADQRYYANNSLVQVDGDIYIAILGDDSVNFNVQKNPTTEPTWWQPLFTKSGSWPLGSTYIQFPGDSDPATLGLPGTWANVSSELAGDFIRFEGGNALAFEAGQQSDALQEINGSIESRPVTNASGTTGTFARGAGAAAVQAGGGASSFTSLVSFSNSNSVSPNPAKTDVNETRAVNRTVRKWRRTA